MQGICLVPLLEHVSSAPPSRLQAQKELHLWKVDHCQEENPPGCLAPCCCFLESHTDSLQKEKLWLSWVIYLWSPVWFIHFFCFIVLRREKNTQLCKLLLQHEIARETTLSHTAWSPSYCMFLKQSHCVVLAGLTHRSPPGIKSMSHYTQKSSHILAQYVSLLHAGTALNRLISTMVNN